MNKYNEYRRHGYKFNKGTQIILDRSYCDISGVEYQLASHVKIYPGERKFTHDTETVSEEIYVRITSDGLKTFEKNLRKGAGKSKLRKKHDDYIMGFLADELDSKLMFFTDGDEEDLAIFTQISKNLGA